MAFNIHKSVISGTATSITLPIPDSPGYADGPGPSSIVINSISGSMLSAAAARVDLYLQWADTNGDIHRQYLAQATNGAAAAIVPLNSGGIQIKLNQGSPLTGQVSVAAVIVQNGTGQTHNALGNSSELNVNYDYE